MDYSKFQVEDFAATESFVDWVNKNDPEAVKFWDLYIQEHPQIKERVEHARQLVLQLQQADAPHTDTAKAELLWEKIQLKTGDAPVTKQRRPPSPLVGIAAVFLLALAAVFYVFTNDHQSITPAYTQYHDINADYVEQINKTQDSLKVQLPDGSAVTIQAGSKIKYKSDYSNDSVREVYLQGEAFFEVAENPYKPFIVHANEVVTKVLGTSFRVLAHPEANNVVVSVKTGKVSVYSELTPNRSATGPREHKEGVILYPNQQVNYERREHSFEKMLVDAPAIITKEIAVTDFTFENAPVGDVFHQLEAAYGIEIEYNEEIIRSCYITAPLGSEPFIEKIKIICQTIGASYEVIDAKVIISSSGC